MTKQCFIDAAKRLLQTWNRDCRRGGLPLDEIHHRDVELLANRIAERFEFYVRDGMEFALMDQSKVDEAIEQLGNFIGDQN